jgi:hypothetical protein
MSNEMGRKEQKLRFKVISRSRRTELTPENFASPTTSIQSTLFPSPRPGLLIFVFFPDVTEDEFKKTLQFAKPGTVVELRSTPRFDIGKLNRKIVFDCFDKEHATYLDLTSKVAHATDSADLVHQVKETFKNEQFRFEKPILFLLSRFNSPPGLSDQVINAVAELKRSKPEVIAIPNFG